jgi:hypothetical protein
LYLLDSDNKVELEGIVTIDNKEIYKVNITNDDEKETKYFEVKSGLLVKSEKVAKGSDGQEVVVPTAFSDYKAVDGILFPHTVKTKAMGQDMEMKLKNIELNKVFTEDTFK